MNKTIAVLFLAALLPRGAAADEKFIQPKYLSGDRSNRVMLLLQKVGPATVVFDPVLNVVILRGKPEEIAATEALLKRLDVPETRETHRQVELVIHLVGAYGRAQNARGASIPADLEPAVKQMKDAFPYKAFTLLDTIVVRGTEANGGMGLKGLLPSTATPMDLAYFYDTGYVWLTIGQDKTTDFRDFHFNIRVPTSGPNITYGDSGITTGVTIREGQKLVLGKLKIDQSPENAVFLVLTSKVE